MTKRHAAALSLLVALGLTFVPEGCGGRPPIPEVPSTLTGQFRACAAEHSHHLGEGVYSIAFDVAFADDGQVDSVALRESTLGDGDL